MLHRIVMVGLVVVGLVVAGLGVASATVWRPSDTAVMTTGSQTGATLLTTAPGVLSLVDPDVTVTARSSGDAKVVLALGSQVDVAGWVGSDSSLRVTGASDWETLTVESLPGTPGTPATPATPATPTDAASPVPPGPDPTGSDMWVTSTSGTGTASLRWDATSTDQVLLVAAVGEDAAAPQLTLSWPREVSTPLLWPGVALGALLVVLGLVYAVVTRGRRTKAPVSAVRGTPVSPDAGAAPAGPLTRRELRELAEREALAAADEEKAPRQKRQWPWTGAIPVVEPATAPDALPVTETVPEPHRPAWLPEGTGSTSGSSWRAAWGVGTPTADAEAPAPETSRAAPRPERTSAILPPARPVDQTSPFQRITLRSSDESAPARRLRRDQQAPAAWTASRSPWAQEARPATGAAPDAPETTDGTTKEND